VPELGKKVLNGNAVNIEEAFKPQSLTQCETMGSELDLLLQHDKGCNTMVVDVNGVVNNSMEVLGEELGVESRAFEQHIATIVNGNITRLRKLLFIPLC
jgi:hypothetical protein